MKLKLTLNLIIMITSLVSIGAISANIPTNEDLTISQTGDGINIAIVYSTGGLGDKSFNDAAFAGIEQAQAAYPDITIAQFEPTDDAGVTSGIIDYADSDTAYDLIIGIGFSAADGISTAAATSPDRNFMIVDAFVDLPNVASISFKEQDGSFLVGAMAALVSETGKLGFLGGLDIPLINRFRWGFYHGAKTVDANVEVSAVYAPDPSNPWTDVSGGKTIGLNFFSDDFDIVFAAAGLTGTGVIEAAAETEGAYAIGVDSDQDYLSEGNVLASMIKRVDVAVKSQIDDVVAGTWSAGSSLLGLAEGGVGISPMTYTMTEANATGAAPDGKTNWEYVQELAADIISGDLVPAEESTFINTTSASATSLPFEVYIISLAIAVPVFFTIKTKAKRKKSKL